MNQARRVSLHVATWMPSVHLTDLLGSLEHQEWKDFQTMVVDDASQEGLAAHLSAYPDVIILRNFKPRGFSDAHNQAVALALSRWPKTDLEDRFIAILHPETVLAPSCLARLVRALESHPSAAAVGPKMLESSVAWGNDGADRERIFSDRPSIIGHALTKSRERVAETSEESAAHLFTLAPSCVLFRASALAQAKIGGAWFDVSLHEAGAFADMMWRLRLLGWQIRFVPEAVAWSARLANDQALQTDDVEWPLVCAKNDAWVNRLFHLPWIVWGKARRIARMFTRPRSWARRFVLIRRYPSVWKQRRELKSRMKVTAQTMRSWFV